MHICSLSALGSGDSALHIRHLKVKYVIFSTLVSG